MPQRSIAKPHPSNVQTLTVPDERRAYCAVKRVADVCLSLFALIILGVFLSLVALVVLAESGRPILYVQTRVGLRGRPFTIYKFRTMIHNAERNGAVWAQRSDPRVTRVGRWLRAVHIDELPQLINVLKGEMSLVGPRPERPEFTEQLSRQCPRYSNRHEVLPGITGWAQVNYRYASSVADTLAKLDYDLQYVRNRSVLLDAIILLKTVAAVLKAQGY